MRGMFGPSHEAWYCLFVYLFIRLIERGELD